MTLAQVRNRHRYNCKFKVAYSDEREIVKTLALNQFKRLDNLNIYLCLNCGYIHLGHVPKWLNK